MNSGIADPNTRGKYIEVDGIPTDGLGAIQTRLSMSRRSGDEGHRRSRSWSLRSPITGTFEPPFGSVRPGRSGRSASGDQQHLMHSYDVEANGLSELAEDSDEDSGSGRKRTSFEEANGHGRVNSASQKAFDQFRR